MSLTDRSDDWQLQLDLLIARAALDSTLAYQLISEPRKCCAENSIDLPSNLKLVVARPDEEVCVKAIPSLGESEMQYSAQDAKPVGSTTFNHSSTTQTQSQTTTTTTTVEVEAEEAEAVATTTTAEAEAEAVLVSVAACVFT